MLFDADASHLSTASHLWDATRRQGRKAGHCGELARPDLDRLDPAVRARFASVVPRLHRAGSAVDWDGRDRQPRLHLVRSGWLAQVRTLADGRRQILRFLMPGDLAGAAAQFLGSMPAPAVALTDAWVASVPVADLIEQRAPLAIRQLCAVLAHAEARAQETLLSLGCRRADERLAALLLDLVDCAAARDMLSDRGLRLPLTQRVLADALAITPVHTNRTVMKLQRAGLIHLRNEWLEILDRPRLEQAAQWPQPTARGEHRLSAAIRLPAQPAPRPAAAPRRILVVEDDRFLALQMQDIIRSLGFEVVGPAASLERGLSLAEADGLDAAFLDVRLEQGQRVFPLARTLQRRSIPFSFMTGYDDPELDTFGAPVIQKPIESRRVQAVIERLVH